MSKTDKVLCYINCNKKAVSMEQLFCLGTFPYLQFAQVHVGPQLQLTQVQVGLLHFTLFVVRMFLFVVVTDFIIVVF